MESSVHKSAISNITGLSVGERDGAWVVRDGETWRELTAEESSAVSVEYDRLYRESLVPKSITPQQFHRGLNKAGLYEQALTMASADFDTKMYFEKSLEFERHHPLLVSMAKVGFGLSDEQIDTMFVEWSTL